MNNKHGLNSKQIWDNAYKKKANKEEKKVWNRLNYLLFKELPKVEKSAFILEAGCGMSVLMNNLALGEHNVIGLDISSIALRNARKKCKKPILVLGDINYLPFKECSFDLVYNVGVIEHFINPHNPLKEFARILKPHGTVLVVVPNRLNLWNFGRIFLNALNRLGLHSGWRYGYERPYTKNELRNLFNSVGLEKPKIFAYGTFEGFYVTAFFSLRRPKFLLQLLQPLFSNDTRSIWGKFLNQFAENLDKLESFGLLVGAKSQL